MARQAVKAYRGKVVIYKGNIKFKKRNGDIGGGFLIFTITLIYNYYFQPTSKKRDINVFACCEKMIFHLQLTKHKVGTDLEFGMAEALPFFNIWIRIAEF
jgi:hypothetical protein